MSGIKLLIVDDHTIVREGLKALLMLEEDIDLVHECSGGMASLGMLERNHYDVVLMDLKMPGIDGIEATRLIKQNYPATKVILLTNYDDEEFVLEAIKVGADGYVLKDVKKGDLINIIRNVLNDKPFIDPGVTYNVIRRVRETIKEGSVYAPRPDLSQRELQILECLVKGLSNKEIADSIYLSLDTVKTHLKNVYKKLGVSSRSQAMKVAIDEKIIHL